MAHFDDDYALALQLQEQFNEEKTSEKFEAKNMKSPSLVDHYWEMTDPNPDVRALFLQFNDRFFWGRLAGIEVRWSPRMTLCAGLCCYEGRGGLCSVRLSVPLLKLRPRKDLVETLLDHDGHGPEFHKHMYRINKEAGTNITVYHNFHDEVESYRQHWWRCNGPCRERKPYYGYVKRTMNRAPSKNDTWWAEHQRTCGGTYTKIREPEDYGKKKGKEKDKEPGKEEKETKKEVKTSVKSMDIRVFGGKGVTLSGQTTSSGNTSSSKVPVSVKKPPSATVTSADMDTDDNIDSPSLLSKPTISKSATASKVGVNSTIPQSATASKVGVNSTIPQSATASKVGVNSTIPQSATASKVGVNSTIPQSATASKVGVNSTIPQSATASKVGVNPKGSSGLEDIACTDKAGSKGTKQSKFTDSDFSDSDDSFLSTVSHFDDVMVSIPDERISGKAVDNSKRDNNNVNSGKDVKTKVDNGTDSEKQIENDKVPDDSNDVRAMLRKVWGEKNIGISNKKKIISKKISGTIQGIKGKSNPLNGLSNTSVVGEGTSFVTSKKLHTTEVGKSKTKVIQHDNKKRHNVVDSFDDVPVSKRLKMDKPTKKDDTAREGIGFSSHTSETDSLDYKLNSHFRESFNGPRLKNDHKLLDRTESKHSGDSKSVKKGKNQDAVVSPGKDKQATNASSVSSRKQIVTPEKNESAKHDSGVKSPLKKMFDTVKSPIEKLFDKIRDKRKGGANNEASRSDTRVFRDTNTETSTCDTDLLRDYDVIPVMSVEVTPVTGETGDISSCPVCNQGVPTASINEHLDLCLTLKAI